MDTSSKIRTNAVELLDENYNNSDKKMSFLEYAENESKNDPNFYCWLFPNADNINDFGMGMTAAQSDDSDNFFEGIKNVTDIREKFEL